MVDQWILNLPLWGLFLILVASLFVLARSADSFIDQAVELSFGMGLPKLIVGVTIVSLGTTFPEVIVSVFSAWHGNYGIALGNAVGSIICDTALILGLASLLGPIQMKSSLISKQAWIQLSAGCLLVLFCLPYSDMGRVFSNGGRLPQWAGFIFLFLLVGYLFLSFSWAKKDQRKDDPKEQEPKVTHNYKIKSILSFMFIALIFILISSELLIITAAEVARRFLVPESVIAITLVAFGTSLPELVTAITSVRKGHGEIALGNVIGADILNVFLVAGASASFSPVGLKADPYFFTNSFPIMILVLVILRIGLYQSKEQFQKKYGLLLIISYFCMLYFNFTKLSL